MDLLGNGEIGRRTAGASVIGNDRQAVARGLGETDIAGDGVGIDLAGEVPPPLLRPLVGEVCSPVVHGQQHAEHGNFRVQPPLDGPERAHQIGQALEGIILALYWDEHAVRRAEGVERQQLQRGRAVDEDVVIGRAQRLERVFQLVFALFHADELDGRTGQLRAGRDDVAVVRVDDGLLGADAVENEVVGCVGGLTLVHAEAGGRVGLRIEVTQQHPRAGRGQRRRQVYGSGRFSHAALLIDDRDDLRQAATSFGCRFGAILAHAGEDCNRAGAFCKKFLFHVKHLERGMW